MSAIKELKQKVKNLKVLFVDDEEVIRDATGVFLHKFFDDVTVCSDGEEGFEKFNKSQDFDIVITDILMPKMDGTEMMRKIKKIKPEVFTVFVTASKGENLIDDANDLYLQKPISFEEITTIMEIAGNTSR